MLCLSLSVGLSLGCFGSNCSGADLGLMVGGCL